MLALISGSGDLPRVVYEALDPKPYVAALEGFPPEGFEADRSFRLETLGRLIADLLEVGVRRVCFAGAIRRPPLDPGKLDAATQPLVPRIMAALQQGDDAALRTVLSFFEEAGMEVCGAHEIVPDLLPDAGVPTVAQPDARAEADALRAAEVVAAMGAADLGQSCVLCQGQVLAVEAAMGTDWMIRTVADARASTPQPANALPDHLRKGGFLHKAPKPGQDLRVDMPVIGPETVQAAAAAALDGVVVQAGSVMVLDLPATVAQADAQGLFLWFRA